jgi:hypothetical protein
MKKGVAALLLIAVIAAGGMFWWINSPPSAVLSAQRALKQHDIAQFHHWVDVHSVAQGAVDDLLAEPVRNIGTGLLERIVGVAIVSLFRDPTVDLLSSQIDRWVGQGKPQPSSMLQVIPPARASSSGDDDDDDADQPQPKSLFGAVLTLIKPPSLKELFKDYGLTKKNFRGLSSFDQSNHLAHVGIKFFSPKLQRDYEIKFELGNTAGNWRIERIANMQELLSELTGG